MAGPLPVRQRTVAFAVPAGAGNYAPEVLYLNQSNEAVAGKAMDVVCELQARIGTIVAPAEVEIDILKPGGDQTQSGDWRTAALSYTTAGLKDAVSLARIFGVRIRVKSGGTGGTQTVDCWWW